MSICLVKKSPIIKQYVDEKLLREVGANLRKARKAKGISIESLANQSDLDYSQIRRMEVGKVNYSLSQLYRVAYFLKIDPKQILP